MNTDPDLMLKLDAILEALGRIEVALEKPKFKPREDRDGGFKKPYRPSGDRGDRPSWGRGRDDGDRPRRGPPREDGDRPRRGPPRDDGDRPRRGPPREEGMDRDRRGFPKPSFGGKKSFGGSKSDAPRGRKKFDE